MPPGWDRPSPWGSEEGEKTKRGPRDGARVSAFFLAVWQHSANSLNSFLKRLPMNQFQKSFKTQRRAPQSLPIFHSRGDSLRPRQHCPGREQNVWEAGLSTLPPGGWAGRHGHGGSLPIRTSALKNLGHLRSLLPGTSSCYRGLP